MKYRYLFGVMIALNIPVGEVVANPNTNADSLLMVGSVNPLDDQQLASYRGGFKFQNDYIVNIGLSIKTAIDGNVMLNSRIANLVIKNGNLKNLAITSEQSQQDVGLVNVIQNGGGNHISVDEISSSYRPEVVTASSITNIVQNTLDNSVIGLSTIVDVDAQVGSALQQVRVAKQLEEAVMARFY
ncbi:hypothetical protein HUO09_05165 [Vibrio sp. Y2-5]|uniref:hypothetical protein n=1 Tax=Vibrio TaxID=662 RepID=UPI00142D3085|nr:MULTISPECIES: hypothetical protein [Vibrio]MBD0785720.1 hypothetical protein [Vibrio sp. Y2-5]NIY91054.1 hypothetical protein [Vibrio diazotrophicus]